MTESPPPESDSSSEVGNRDGDAMTDDPSDSQPSESSTKSGKGLLARFKVPLSRKRLVTLAFVLVGVGGLAWYSTTPAPIATDKPLELSDSIRFSQELERVLKSETTRLYIADFVVDDAMLLSLPIEELKAAKQKAIDARELASNQTERGEEGTEIYNEAGKRVNFDPPVWQDYPKLDTVLIDQGIVTRAGLAKIAELPGLEHLRLRLSPIVDEDLEPLLGCKDLWLLNLPHSQLSKDGIVALARLPKLKQLRIGSDRLTNDCCRAIAKLQNLRGLHLIGVPITDDGVKVLSELPHLESLYMDDSAVTDSGWDWVFRNHPQLHVHVNQTHHDRDPQSHAH